MKRQDEQRRARGLSRRGFLQAVGVTGLATVPASTSWAQETETQTQQSADGITRYAPEGERIELRINGQNARLRAHPTTTLLEALREHLAMTGAKEVCDRGACGACTVHLDGRAVKSCMTLAIDAIGYEITTVEGLAQGEQLDPVQQAFVDNDACQCGFCIPGFVMRSRALLDENPAPNEQQIKEGLSGNICRCAAYNKIFQAVADASKRG
jgi:aerobic-type carbon monoxide dehydrogenase small subunit (CoxS/CutS family)